MLDNIEEDSDRSLARHIARLYTSFRDYDAKAGFGVEQLRSYIKFARTLEPSISDDASSFLATSYVGMRKINGSSGKTIAATTRQLESLIRLSEAHAKIR